MSAEFIPIEPDTPITLNGKVIGRVISQDPETGVMTTYIDPGVAPIHGYSETLGMTISIV